MTPLNPYVIEAFKSLPSAQGYRFHPVLRAPTDPKNPRDPHYDGVTSTIRVGGDVVAKAADDGATYCCGVTFELWWKAQQAAGGVLPSDVSEVRELVAEWFCPTMGHPGVVNALARRGWGERVAVHDAIAGDFVQYWRRVQLDRPSGHSAVVLEVCGDRLTYMSSQPATSGVGVHHETIGPDWQVHVVRPWLTTT